MKVIIFVLLVAAANAEYYSYTRANLDIAIEVFEGDVSSNGNLNPLNPTKFIVHDANGNSTESWILNLKNQFLVKINCNVIVYKWLGDQASVEAAGRSLGTFYGNRLNESYLLEDFHCLGWGLGAHVCGFSGKEISSPINGNLSRISGLDPTSTGYFIADPTTRLSNEDADIVDIIHTSRLGFDDAFGTVDFYPNGGTNQPGCGVDLGNACSHGRAHSYYIESLTDVVPNNDFLGLECINYNIYSSTQNCNSNPVGIMGEFMNVTIGTFFLNTNRDAPYATGKPTP